MYPSVLPRAIIKGTAQEQPDEGTREFLPGMSRREMKPRTKESENDRD